MQKFAVFDIDGTFFRSHLYWEVVLEMARSKNLHSSINHRTLELYDLWKRRAHHRSFNDFDQQTIASIDQLIAELDPLEYDKALVRALPPMLDQVYIYTRDLAKKLKDEGYFLLAISGSRIEEVDIFAKHHGFDDWTGQQYQRSADGKSYTGQVVKTYKDKHLILEQFVKKHNLTYDDSYGIGDTASDISLLEVVANPIAFNPNDELLAKAQSQGWPIVLERKNVIYQLTNNKKGCDWKILS
jgi:HAD superfamily phosphoserine phosphatase-like hydrolase